MRKIFSVLVILVAMSSGLFAKPNLVDELHNGKNITKCWEIGSHLFYTTNISQKDFLDALGYYNCRTATINEDLQYLVEKYGYFIYFVDGEEFFCTKGQTANGSPAYVMAQVLK